MIIIITDKDIHFCTETSSSQTFLRLLSLELYLQEILIPVHLKILRTLFRFF